MLCSNSEIESLNIAMFFPLLFLLGFSVLWPQLQDAMQYELIVYIQLYLYLYVEFSHNLETEKWES